MSHPDKSRQNTLTIGALGVVFGDIGTSPLYTIKEAFGHAVGLTPDTNAVLGVLSLIFWLLAIVVSGKYVSFIMRADNKGEGGSLVLHALALRAAQSKIFHRFIIILGILGAAFFFGDCVITPAISVLGAMEGIEVAVPQIESLIVPITIAIMIVLFSTQSFGTNSIGKLFGPVMLLWFSVIGLLGLRAIIEHPVVLQALNPLVAVDFIIHHQAKTFVILGAVVLAVTGAEALYADMGHFGRKPIARAWYFFAMPGLLLNYFGQGGLLLDNPEAVKNPFFMLAPDWLQVPLVVLSTAAAIIASQATISGAFSITRQAVQLGYLPRMKITHTSEHEAGQIYIPAVNIIMMISVILLVLMFRTSGNLASAYGISVTATMGITTFLAFVVSRKLWKWPALLSLSVCTPLLLLDTLLFASNAFKIIDGGWITLAIAAAMLAIMLTWLDGSRVLYRQITRNTVPLSEFLASLADKNPVRVPGIAVYLVRTAGDTPHALLRNFKHNQVIHERVVILHLFTKEEPTVSRAGRYTVSDLGQGFVQLDAYYGFMELPSIPLLLKQCVEEKKLDVDMGCTSFVVTRVTIIPDKYIGLPLWQSVLFKWLHINSMRAHEFYRIPTSKALEIGIQVRV